MSDGPSSWLRFCVGEGSYAIPLHAVAEVMTASTPHLIPLVPIQLGGVVNVRGEALPVVEGHALLQRPPVEGGRHILVLENGSARIGIRVSHVSGLLRNPAGRRLEEESTEVEGSLRWVLHADQRLGLVDPEGLFERAAELLLGPRTPRGEGPCPDVF